MFTSLSFEQMMLTKKRKRHFDVSLTSFLALFFCHLISLNDKEIFVSACNFIGLLNESDEKWNEFKKRKLKITEDEINTKILDRNNARKNKDFIKADKIRDELEDKGVLIEDKDDKTHWKFK